MLKRLINSIILKYITLLTILLNYLIKLFDRKLICLLKVNKYRYNSNIVANYYFVLFFIKKMNIILS
uniref:Uncharacterized protein n=1 Tax=Compsopogon caeruleus TaxID=31354 RepID=A0A1Z1XB92_9RHOD|nr:hypothetical protein [Compsopogon caeruleus]ARX96132.1 hypothetical protein [Compsopogon caeruleus]